MHKAKVTVTWRRGWIELGGEGADSALWRGRGSGRRWRWRLSEGGELVTNRKTSKGSTETAPTSSSFRGTGRCVRTGQERNHPASQEVRGAHFCGKGVTSSTEVRQRCALTKGRHYRRTVGTTRGACLRTKMACLCPTGSPMET